MTTHVNSIPISNGTLVNVDDTLGEVAYYGITISETASAAAVVRIRQGSVTGLILDTINLAALGSASRFYGPDGLRCRGDLYCQVASGTVEGSVRYG